MARGHVNNRATLPSKEQEDPMRTRKIAVVAVLMVGSLFITVAPSYAWWHRGWWGPSFWVWAPPPVIESAPVYAHEETPRGYWYFCPSSRAYYPSVQSCSEAWIKVPPQQQ